MTLSDFILEAGIMASIFAAGDPLPSSEAQYGWRKLNDLIDLMKTNRLMMYQRIRVGPFSVTAGQGDISGGGTNIPAPITIGVGGTWNTPRPIWIDGAGLIYTAGSVPNIELPVRVFTVDEWKDIRVKGIQATISRALIYDQTFGASGLGNIYLYPVPSASFQIVLYVPSAIDEFAPDSAGNPDFSLVISMAPGHRMAYISNLAKIMCIGLVEVSQDLKDLARESLAELKASNVVQHMDTLHCDEAVLGRDERTGGWDWIGGGFR